MSSVNPNFLKNTPSEIRNRVLAPIFKDCKLIEQWGSGFRKIYADLANYPTIALKIHEPGLSFQMQFVKTDYVSEHGATSGTLNGTLNIPKELFTGLNDGLRSLLSAIHEFKAIQFMKYMFWR